MSVQNLLKDARIVLSSAAVSAGTTTIDGGVIDMASGGGADAACAIVTLGDVTATSVLTLSWYESDNSDGSSPTAVSGAATTAFTAGASDADSKQLVADCCNFSKRYVFPRLTRTTANAVVSSINTIVYRAKNKPVTQSSDIIASVLLP